MRKKKAKKNSPKMHKLKPPPKSYCPQKKCKKIARVGKTANTHSGSVSIASNKKCEKKTPTTNEQRQCIDANMHFCGVASVWMG